MTQMPGKRERNKQANRTAILAAARHVFMELGYDAVTIRDVIRATHLAAGTFYNYFPDKESVFRALLEEHMASLTSRLSEARRAARDTEHFLLDAYRAVFTDIGAQPEFYAMLFRNEPVIRSLYSDNVFGASMRALKADLRDGIARGVLPEVDVDYLAAAMFGAAFELARMMLSRKDRDPAAAAQFATRLFLGGVQALADAASLIRKGSLRIEGAKR